MRSVYAGVDIGGTNTVLVLYDERRRPLAKTRFPTLGERRELYGNPSGYMDRLETELRRATEELFPSGGARLTAVGIGVPGQVAPETGIVRDATNLGWGEVELAGRMAARLRTPVRIEHDVRAFAWGETMAGSAQGSRVAICLTIGTGIAAGVVLDGRLVYGSRYLAGEIGHDSVDGLRTACACGKTGCLETVVSAPGIARLAEQAGLGDAGGYPSRPSAADVSRMCEDNDERALNLYRYVAGTLAGKLGTAVALLDPDVVVIGGGVAEAGEWLFGPLRERLDAAFPWLEGKLRIVKSALGEDAVPLGALHLAYPED
ncbi:ROK family protein [Cohnella cellulosilytica]|uniref:ROK family protein n=1 Tax=Cohnella cellulosilytica TaxID=986710 RepID=A0ABW2FGD1_9BACL